MTNRELSRLKWVVPLFIRQRISYFQPRGVARGQVGGDGGQDDDDDEPEPDACRGEGVSQWGVEEGDADALTEQFADW